MKVNNPWTKLPRKPPFILRSDRTAIAAFNKKAKRDFRLHDHLMPIPYLGSPSAHIVLLHLNPGYSPQDETRQTTKKFVETSRRSLLHRKLKYPFYFLDPDLEGNKRSMGPGHAYWSRRFGKELLNRFGNRLLSQNIFCLEYFPYRSRYNRPFAKILDSQYYGFALLRRALRRNAIVVILRSRARWFAAVPELKRYRRKFALNSLRNATISARNCPKGYKQIVRALELAKRCHDDKRIR